MEQEKQEGKFSHITLEKAPDEDVVRVSAAGVEQVGAPVVDARSEDAPAPVAPPEAGSSGSKVSAAQGQSEPEARDRERAAHAPADDAPLEEPGHEPVPMAGMQKAIIAVLVVALVAFIVYFALNG